MSFHIRPLKADIMTDVDQSITRSHGVFDKQFELLKLEMTLIDSAIRSQDDITKSIKNWGIVTWTASVGFAVASPALKSFVWATAFVPLAFWIVDGFFRRIQRTFIVRVQEIATFVNSSSEVSSAPMTGTGTDRCCGPEFRRIIRAA